MSLHKRETAGRRFRTPGEFGLPQEERLIGKRSKGKPTNRQKAKKRNR